MIRPLLALLLVPAVVRADLVATFTREGATDTRTDRIPAISLAAGEPATPFLGAGAFEVVWKGEITLPRRQRLTFSFEGEGAADLQIDGKPVLAAEGEIGAKASKSTRLNPGAHEIAISYKSQPDGSASFRLFWEEASFPRQTIPPSAFTADVDEASALAQLQRRGRLVFAMQNCAKCHTSATGFGAAPMPEMVQIAPLLFGSGERTSEEWLRRWIADPKALKPGTEMPTLVDASTEEGRQQAGDLAAYVASLKSGTPAAPAPDPALARQGGVHFRELGCVGCHNLPDKGLADPDRLQLNNVASKFLPGALTAFLKKPDTYHPFIRMPDFHLSDDEAAALAAYLGTTSAGHETKLAQEIPAGNAARGAALAASLQCGVCHAGMPLSPATMPDSLEKIFGKDWAAGGCAAPADRRGKAPHLNLTDADRTALVAFSKTGAASLSRHTPAEYTARNIGALRCTACHNMDGEASVLSKVQLETAPLVAHLPKIDERLDQSRPQLTYIGEMLHTTAIQAMIAGTEAQRPRPWLAMRMPAFTSRAAQLANGFSRLHGLAPNEPGKVDVDPARAEIGAKLVSSESGFGCTTCHGIGAKEPTAAFEVQGINFELIPSRLRLDYFHRWMADPKSITPTTKMPSYSKDGKSQRTDILGGDAKAQFDAIWQYLHQ